MTRQTCTTAAKAAAADRVPRSHAQTRATLRLTLAFLAAGAIVAGLGGSRWLVLHLVLAGGAVTAISAVSLMLTVTWSAAPAPSDACVRAQRAAIALGATGVAVGHDRGLPVGVVAAAGGLYLVGLALLGGLLAVTVRRGTERRFDLPVGAYVVALAAGVAGGGLGVWMAIDGPFPERRGAHLTTNLLGLVGIVVAATLPFFAATVGRTRMSPLARRPLLLAAWSTLVAGISVAHAGLLGGHATLAATGFATYALGLVAVLALVPRPSRRQLRWAGPRLVALWAGSAWWLAAVVATAAEALAGTPVLSGRWLVVLALGAYGQILWGSLAYLLPMLRGGGPTVLSTGFATTRSWTGLAGANALAAAVAVGGGGRVLLVPAVIWVADAAWRAARVGTRRAHRPATDPGADPDTPPTRRRAPHPAST